MADRVRIFAAAALLGALTACAPMYGPPPPGRSASLPPADDTAFRAGDFAWSQAPGRNTISAGFSRAAGAAHYTCAGSTVVLTPETPWSTRRMQVLYKSDQRAALPIDDVRSRQNLAPPGDSDPYVKKVACDASGHFTFTGLPDGGWYIVTIAKPVAPATGPNLAMMRKVLTKGGKVTALEL